MGSATKPELQKSGGGASAFERILERESELQSEVEDARERGRQLIAHAQDNREELIGQIQEEGRRKAQKESDSIKSATQEKIDALQAQHQQESDILRSGLERTIGPAIDMVVGLVTGTASDSQPKAQGGEA